MKQRMIQFLSWVIAIIILIGMIYTIFWGVSVISKILSLLQTLDAVVIVALLTGFITVLTTIIKSLFDVVLERKKYLNEKKEKSYIQFIDMIYKINNPKTGHTSEIQIEDLQKFSQAITLYGSKGVVNKWAEFRQYSNSSNVDGKVLLKISDQLMNEMRRDLGVGKVKEKQLLSFLINDIENLE